MSASPPSTARRHRGELLATLVERQARLRLKRSVIGVVWPLLAPLMLFGLYAEVFGSIFDVPVPRYGVYLFAGLLPWTFLVQAVHDALQSISFEPELVRRARFDYELLPLARVVVMTISFFVLLLGFIAYLAVDGTLRPALLPALVLPLASVILLVASLSMLVALLDVFSRELRYVLNNLLTVWFFLVPIVYHPRMESDVIRAITRLDPMRVLVGQFRAVLYDGHIASPAGLPLATAGCLAAFVASLWLFRRLAVDLAQDV
ncbi:MAG: ABC transporter permease [Acidimicrobiia bacterium]